MGCFKVMKIKGFIHAGTGRFQQSVNCIVPVNQLLTYTHCKLTKLILSLHHEKHIRIYFNPYLPALDAGAGNSGSEEQS